MNKEIIALKETDIIDTTSGEIVLKGFDEIIKEKKKYIQYHRENIFTIEKASKIALETYTKLTREEQDKKDIDEFIEEDVEKQFKEFKKIKSSFSTEVKGSNSKSNPITGINQIYKNIKDKYMKPFLNFEKQIKEIVKLNNDFINELEPIQKEFKLGQMKKRKQNCIKWFEERNKIKEITYELIEEDKFYKVATSKKYVVDTIESFLIKVATQFETFEMDAINGKRNKDIYIKSDFNFDATKEEISKILKQEEREKQIREDERKKVEEENRKETIKKEQKIVELEKEKVIEKTKTEEPKKMGTINNVIEKITTEKFTLTIEADIGYGDKLYSSLSGNVKIKNIEIKKEKNE